MEHTALRAFLLDGNGRSANGIGTLSKIPEGQPSFSWSYPYPSWASIMVFDSLQVY
jgi:hypothetical protein